MSKGTKVTIATRLGFKSAGPSKVEPDRVRKETAHLNRKMDELANRQIKQPDPDKIKLLEVVASLQVQLEQCRQYGEQRDRSFQNLTEETEDLKNRLAVMSSCCQALEGEAMQGAVTAGDLAAVQDELQNALENNKRWLVYDQEREAYVRSMLAHTLKLEQQLAQTNPEDPASKVAAVVPEMQTDSTQLLQVLQRDLEAQRAAAAGARLELQQHKDQHERRPLAQREEVGRLLEELASLQRSYGEQSDEVSSLQRSYKERSRELEHTKDLLQTELLSNRQVVSEDRMVSSDRMLRMRHELENVDTRLAEERKRSADLLLQVNLLQKSLLSRTDEHRRIATLEQQIHLSVKDFEREKLDRQSMQQQLHKVLKELRKTRDQPARLESKPTNTRFSEPSSYHVSEFERLAIMDHPGPESPSKVGHLLDESFLQCSNCHISYPASQHRELLAHIEICMA
ncbi:hypothetical protein NHX12_024459 [Muraenolepis orangiensis]|uniref:TSG101 and ALIX binding domain-containing protein n=1 Tax=Muraenolepis orangiensis TaxID=630683 RepID=A0A9Q0IRA5_9TELE|nr:hypothetical protein NHX12_024459 [Muraenolepis orangiensis]